MCIEARAQAALAGAREGQSAAPKHKVKFRATKEQQKRESRRFLPSRKQPLPARQGHYVSFWVEGGAKRG